MRYQVPRLRHPLVWLGGTIFVLTMGCLALHVPGVETVGTGIRTAFVALLAVTALVYLVAVYIASRHPATRGMIWFVLAVAAGMRLPLIFDTPFLSTDIYRYIWDGRVQTAGFNPYRYIPADAELASLRDTAIYPRVSRAEYAPTIYPPTAQFVFHAVAFISQSVSAMKLAMVCFEALAIAAVIGILRLAHLPMERVLIYAWNPLATWAFAGNGHVDAIGIGLLALALLLRGLRRDTLMGAVLGAAVLVKLFPIAVAPALWRRTAAWRAPIACAAVIIGLYGYYYSSAGWQMLGFLPGYASEEELVQGSGIWLLAGLGHIVPLTPLAAKLYAASVVVGLAALGGWIAFRPRLIRDQTSDVMRVSGDTAILAASVTVAISPHFPWYFAWLALPSCVQTWWSVVYLSVAPVLLYLDPLHERFFWPSLVYIPATILAVQDIRHRLHFQRVDPTCAIERSA